MLEAVRRADLCPWYENLDLTFDLLQYVEWRGSWDGGDPGWIPPQPILDDMVYRRTGSDVEGRPVYILLAGRCDPRVLIEGGLREDIVRYVHQFLERVVAEVEESRRRGEDVTQALAIVDLHGLTFMKAVHLESEE
jgi:hypothetical protein